MKLTIVIPTYNEAENLQKLTTALFALPLDNLSVLVVDDNSPDGTGEIADELSFEYKGSFSVIHRSGKLGLGTAYVEGFERAIAEKADAIGQMDADFSHPVEKIPELVEALSFSDAVIGSRYVENGSVDERWPAWRKGLSAFGNIYARTILGLPVRDVTGGFRLWRRETLMHMPLAMIRSNGYAFQVETTYIAHRLGFRFGEVPIYFADRRWGTSKMSFRIQREAAIRVWQMLAQYRHLERDALLRVHSIQH
jgi:dolichol-phosphate mannosyltransferase